MTVLIDADGCPVVDIAAALCQKYRIPCQVFCDTAHEFRTPGAEILVVDKGSDSVDYAIANRIRPGNLAVTQDYGLASMCLAKGAAVLHQDGWEYTKWNIDALLLQRHESRKYRASGGRQKGPAKRKPEQNEAFRSALERILMAQNSDQG